MVPKLSIAKATKAKTKALGNRDSFALTDLAVDSETSPIVRQSALKF